MTFEVASISSLGPKSIIESVLMDLSGRDEQIKTLIADALKTSENALEQSLLSLPEGQQRDATIRARDEIRRFLSGIGDC